MDNKCILRHRRLGGISISSEDQTQSVTASQLETHRSLGEMSIQLEISIIISTISVLKILSNILPVKMSVHQEAKINRTNGAS